MSTISASTTTTTAYKVTADTTGTLVLQTGSTPTTAMTIDSSQNVGIGTSSPGYKLDVKGSSGDIFRVADGTNADLLFGTNSTGPYAFVPSAAALRFGTSNTERARIDSSGNLLVGCTAYPSSSVKGFGITDNGSGPVVTTATNTTANKTHYSFQNTNGQVGYILTSGSTTTYSTSSDYRLKTTVEPMTGALAKVAALKPCTYKWKVDGSDGEGFIAHELAEICPHAVTGEKDAVDAEGNPVYQGIDTSFLVATLTAAIQELKAELDALKAKVGE